MPELFAQLKRLVLKKRQAVIKASRGFFGLGHLSSSRRLFTVTDRLSLHLDFRKDFHTSTLLQPIYFLSGRQNSLTRPTSDSGMISELWVGPSGKRMRYEHRRRTHDVTWR